MKNLFPCALRALIYKLLMTSQSTRESRGDGVWGSGFFIGSLVFSPVRVEHSPCIFLAEDSF
jgi:hypothetical protein